MAHPIVDLYRRILEGWNARNAKEMTHPLASDATVVGFDGSVHSGRQTIESQMADLFRNHPTARYVADLEMLPEIGPAGALLRAVAGLIPPGSSAVKPAVCAPHDRCRTAGRSLAGRAVPEHRRAVPPPATARRANDQAPARSR